MITGVGGSIVLDPGHGGSDHGASYDGVDEDDLNLRVCREAQRQAVSAGLPRVYLTRGDVARVVQVDFHERLATARALGASGIISVHHNAHRSHPEFHGAEGYHWPGNMLTAEVVEYACQLMPAELRPHRIYMATDNDGPNDDWLLRPRHVLAGFRELPVALVEVGYLSNKHDRAYCSSDLGIGEVANTLLAARDKFAELVIRSQTDTDGRGGK
jgi:N-acetylmuramoyl-L-alanine amidase